MTVHLYGFTLYFGVGLFFYWLRLIWLETQYAKSFRSQGNRARLTIHSITYWSGGDLAQYIINQKNTQLKLKLLVYGYSSAYTQSLSKCYRNRGLCAKKTNIYRHDDRVYPGSLHVLGRDLHSELATSSGHSRTTWWQFTRGVPIRMIVVKPFRTDRGKSLTCRWRTKSLLMGK